MDLQNIFIQADMIRLRKDQVKVFQSLRKPEALHLVAQLRQRIANVVNGRVTIFGTGHFVDILKHAPRHILKGLVASDAVHDEDGFDGLGAEGRVSMEWIRPLVRKKSIGEPWGSLVPKLVCCVRDANYAGWKTLTLYDLLSLFKMFAGMNGLT